MPGTPLRTARDIGVAVSQARKKRQMLQSELAHKAGLTQPTISALETTGNVRVETLLAVLAVLDLDLTIATRQRAAFDPTKY